MASSHDKVSGSEPRAALRAKGVSIITGDSIKGNRFRATQTINVHYKVASLTGSIKSKALWGVAGS